MSKSNKITKAYYHEVVSPAICSYRREMQKSLGITGKDHYRVFTEQRSRGARSKFWMIRNSFPVEKVINYVQTNPTITAADGSKYEVSFWFGRGGSYYGGTDASLFINKI